MSPSGRSAARFAAPAAFLAAITIAVLLVHSALQRGSHPATGPTTTVQTQTTRSGGHKTRHGRLYTVRPGDTFGSIAGKTGTSVSQLEHLNPHVNPTSLQVGEKIRVQ